MASTESIENSEIKKNRKVRRFGMKNSILSAMTVYFDSYEEDKTHLSVEEAAIYAAVAKYFNECE